MSLMTTVTFEVTSSALGDGIGGMGRRETFALSTPLLRVKERLLITVGTSVEHQRLLIRRVTPGEAVAEGGISVVADLSNCDDNALLGQFVPIHLQLQQEELLNLHVVDVDPEQTVARFADVDSAAAKLAKFELSEADYEKRPDTFRAWKRENPQAYADWKAKMKAQERARRGLPPLDPDAPVYDIDTAPANVEVGSRCAVAPLLPGSREHVDTSGDVQARPRGTVRFVGTTDFAPGYWVGIELDEPGTGGKHDGAVQGRRYFGPVADSCGVFVRGNRITCGDFPERDFMDELDEVEDDEL